MAKRKIAEKIIDFVRSEGPAREVGFDTRGWYHGGSGMEDMIEIDPGRLGSSTGTPASQEAFFLTREEPIAQEFAKNASIKSGRPGEVKEFFYRPGNETAVIDWDEYFPDLPVRSNNGQRMLASILMDAKDQGSTGILIKNADDSLSGKKNEILAVLDRTRLRYPYAEFNPEKLTSPNLLAGALPAAIGIGAATKGGEASAKDIERLRLAEAMMGGGAQPTIPGDVGGIQAVEGNPQMVEFARMLREYSESPIGPWLGGTADLVEKHGYGQKRSPYDYMGAALDFL